jgi:queuosine precursor transporter
MPKVFAYKFTIFYLVSVLSVVTLFKYWPLLIDLGYGIQITPWALLVGGWFVLRDFSQREIGHYVFIPMILGVLIATIVSPAMGIASILANSTSEFMDWLVYTLIKRPFHQRIIISSLVAAPIDTLVFFSAFDYFQVIPGVSIFNWGTIALAILSKLIAALIVYQFHREVR